jgi:CheY-like chemotaxis protein
MERLRILVAEDDAMIALLLDLVLRDMGHEICANEESEREAIAAALRCKPDLMIVDANLGEGSGTAVVDAVLKERHVAHLFVTGDARRIKALRPDAIVIEKPFFEVDLARAIEQAMSRDPAAPSRENAVPRPAEPLERV